MEGEGGTPSFYTTMDKRQIRSKIEDFMDSGRKDYVSFWVDNFPASNEQILKLQGKEQKDVGTGELIYSDEGVYDNYCKLDFRKFSFYNLKHVYEDSEYSQDINKIVKVISNMIDQYDREPRRFKKLRIYFFESLLNRSSSLYSPDLYIKARKSMAKSLDRVVDIVKGEDKEIISKLWDSVTFRATKEEGKGIREKVNSFLNDRPVSLEFYTRFIKFRNIMLYDTGDESFIKKTNGTDYDDAKIEVAYELLNDNYDEAIEIIKNDNDISDKLKRSYFKTIGVIKDEG